MTDLTEPLCVPGPLHPDMFDGETPILMPLKNPPNAYEVWVSFSVVMRGTRMVRVAAHNKSEAERAAVELLERDASSNEDNFEAEGAERLERPPNDYELKDWHERRGSGDERG